MKVEEEAPVNRALLSRGPRRAASFILRFVVRKDNQREGDQSDISQ